MKTTEVIKQQLMDYQRGVLALRMKPIIEARALAAMLEGKNQHSSPSEISHEADQSARIEGNAIGGGKSSEKSHETSPMRTDEVVAGLANLGKDTIRKIEHIEQAVFLERINQAGGVGFMACDCRNVMRELQSMKGTI
jgi:hypothetical protein